MRISNEEKAAATTRMELSDKASLFESSLKFLLKWWGFSLERFYV